MPCAGAGYGSSANESAGLDGYSWVHERELQAAVLCLRWLLCESGSTRYCFVFALGTLYAVRFTMPAAADTAEDEGSFTWSENSPVKIVWCCVRVFLQHHVVAASEWGAFLDNTASASPAYRHGQLDVSLITCQVCSFTFYNTEMSCGKDPFLLIICRSAITTFRHSVIAVQLLKLLFSWFNAVERLRGDADLAAADICQ